MRTEVLDHFRIEKFCLWFHHAYRAWENEPEVKEIYRPLCPNKLLGELIQNFGLSMIGDVIHNLPQQRSADNQAGPCPLSAKEKTVLLQILRNHLRDCRLCRLVNSIHLAGDCFAETREHNLLDEETMDNLTPREVKELRQRIAQGLNTIEDDL